MAKPYGALGAAAGKSLKKATKKSTFSGVSAGVAAAAPVAAAPKAAKPIKKVAKKRNERKLNRGIRKAAKAEKSLERFQKRELKRASKSQDKNRSFARPREHDEAGGLLPLGVVGDLADEFDRKFVSVTGRRGSQIASTVARDVGGTARDVGGTYLQAAKATVEHPGEVALSSINSIPEILAGTVAAPYEFVKDPRGFIVHGGEELKRLHNPDTAYEVARKEGILPYAFEVTPAGKLVSRGAGAVLKRASSRGKTFMTAPRPKMRTSAGKVTDQPKLKKGIVGVALQRAVDKGNVKRSVERVVAAERGGKRRPVEAGPGEVVPRYAARARYLEGREATSTRSRASNRHKVEHKESVTNLRRRMRKLPKDSRRALRHIYELGLVPDAKISGRVVDRRLASIEKGRAKARSEGKPAEPSKRLIFRGSDEKRELEWLRQNLHVITPDARKYADDVREVVKQAAHEDPTLDSIQAELRRATPLARTLGVEKKQIGTTVKKRLAYNVGRRDYEIRDLHEPVSEPSNEYLNRTQRAAQEAGLAEPGYVKHVRDFQENFASKNVGRRAKGGSQKTAYKLHDTGRSSSRPETLFVGLEENLKRKHSHRLVEDLVRDHAILHDTTYNAIAKHVEDTGIAWKDVTIVDMGRLTKDAKARVKGESEGLAPHDLVENFRAAKYTPGTKPEGKLTLVSRSAAESIDGMMAPTTKRARVASLLFKRLPQTLLLNSPEWLLTQVVGNQQFAAVVGVGPQHVLLAKRELARIRKSDPELYAELRAEIGDSPISREITPTKMGSLGGSLSGAAEGFLNSPIAIRIADSKLRNAEPLTLMLRLGRGTDNAYREAVFMTIARREAFKNMDRSATKLLRIASELVPTLKLSPEEQLTGLLKNQSKIREFAKQTDEILGNYTSFSPAERTALESFVPFYGFLRFSLLWSFMLMPTRHPIMTSILGELSVLHEGNVRRILKAGPNDPLAFKALAKVYNEDGTVSQDFSRFTPTLNALTALGGNSGGLVSFVPPGIGLILNQAASENLYRAEDYKVRGESRSRVDLMDPVRLKILEADIEQWIYPLRKAREYVAGGAEQGADASLIFGMEPTQYAKGVADKRNKRRMEIAPKTPAEFIRQTIPGAPKPSLDVDITKDLIQGEEEDAKAAAKKVRKASGAPKSTVPSTPAEGAAAALQRLRTRQSFTRAPTPAEGAAAALQRLRARSSR